MENRETEDALKIIKQLADLLVKSHSHTDSRRKIDVFIEAANQISGALNGVAQKIADIEKANRDLSQTVADLKTQISELKRIKSG
ncbi:hypothetical protein [Bdellovibrio sp.]|uniref:hypothetical protein n=1 Tax=Bdellovibrio sp. TaxID=28201 RepID=UPI0039E296C3